MGYTGLYLAERIAPMTEDEEISGADGPAGSVSRTPPYISYSTLLTFLGDLKEHGIPPQIDRSVLTRFSGGVQSQLMLALKALGLVAERDRPTPLLKELVDAYQSDRFAEKMRGILRETYPYVFALDLMTATPSMFARAFSDNLSAKEEVLRKCRTFFLHAAKEAGVRIGTRIETAKFPRSRSPSSRRSSPRNNDSNGNVSPEPAEGLPPKSLAAPISEKALEYRLVDLMSEAAGNAEVMTSIINVITFLKTKDADKSAQTANGNSLTGDE